MFLLIILSLSVVGSLFCLLLAAIFESYALVVTSLLILAVVVMLKSIIVGSFLPKGDILITAGFIVIIVLLTILGLTMQGLGLTVGPLIGSMAGLYTAMFLKTCS